MANSVTNLISRCKAGDQAALNELLPLVYGELHRIAANYLRKERPDHTL